MREILNLNSGWRFSPDFKPEYTHPDFKDTAFKLVDLPHVTFSPDAGYVNERTYKRITCYRKMFILPDEMKKRRLILHFEGVASSAATFVNGKPVCAHKGGFTPFSCDITQDISEYIKGGDNLITVVVDSTEREDTAPFGGQSDMLYYGGLYREVRLEAVDSIYVEDIFARTTPEEGGWLVDIDGQLSDKGANVTIELRDGYRVIASDKFNCGENCFSRQLKLKDIEPWSVDSPKLYGLTVSLDSGDSFSRRIGFRTAEFKPEGFYLNGQRVQLTGLARNQSYSRAGWAMPAAAQRHDADLIKELGCNIVRTLHCPPSKHFLDRCDEIGLLVLDEMPGRGFIGEGEWQESAERTLEELITRDRNHPSVIMWSTRVEEAGENDAFYTRTAEIARRLDGTRTITGIRNTPSLELKEDVFCFNDYSCNGTNAGLEKKKNIIKAKVPYLVTGHTGIRFPAKGSDSESTRLEHALRHAKALDAAYGEPESCGIIGSVFADYNVPKLLGGNDNVCYYGVTDANRIKKLAAYVYQSQSDAQPVLQLSSSLSGGTYPNSICPYIYAFTNCDSVRVLRNGKPVGEFTPDRKKYPNMPHPPILINDLIGDLLTTEEGIEPKEAAAVKAELLSMQRDGVFSSADLRARGGMSFSRSKAVIDMAYKLYDKYIANSFGGATFTFEGIKGGEVTQSIVLEPVSQTGLKIDCSTHELFSNETYDCARVELTAIDQNGNRLYDCFDAVSIECDGSIDIIGSKLFALSGGAAAFYVRTKNGKGPAKAKITTESLGRHVVEFNVTRTAKRDI